MGFATFSGPVLVGPTKEGSGRTLGSVVLSQTGIIPFANMTTGGTATTLFTLPAGTKVLGIFVNKTTAVSGGSVSAIAMTIGRAGSSALYVASFNPGLGVGRTTFATVDGAAKYDNLANIGTSDIAVTATVTTTTGNPTAGQIEVTFVYVQNTVDGVATPVTP